MSEPTKKHEKPVVRCAVYTRKSSEEGLDQDFNSLDAQREAAEAYVKSQQHEGWTVLVDRYDDGGYSGGNADRPGVQRLLADVAAGKVDCVVVYKVDRLSRSLADFARMMETFDRHKVAFVSVTQAFNTASSMGRLVLNVLLSFAQFEREISGERIRDKIAATRRKGKWSGGPPPLGYDVKTGPLRIEVNTDEAERVRAIFTLYQEHGAMLPVLKEIEQRGWRTKPWTSRKGVPHGGRVFTKNALHQLLTCVIYAGKQRYKDEVHPGEHQAIVDPDVWQAVQDRLARNKASGATRSRSECLLAGILKCGPCGRAMAPTYTTKRNRGYRYYTCTTAAQRGWDKCPSKSVPAAEVERFVLAQVPGGEPGSPRAQAAHLRSKVEKVEYDGGTGRLAITLHPPEAA